MSAIVFKFRGAILSLGALLLVIFGHPTPAGAVFGVLVALAGEAVRVWAVGYSGVTTRADHVTAPALVTAGPYAYVRNPLYVGNFITAVGFVIAFTSGLALPSAAILAALALGLMVATYAIIIPYEEAYLTGTFGEAFAAYVATVPRVIPRSRKAPGTGRGTYRPEVIWKAETRTFITFVIVLALLLTRLGIGR